MCSSRTAGRTPHSCGRSSAVPRESLATIQVSASPSPQSTQHPTLLHLPAPSSWGAWAGWSPCWLRGGLATAARPATSPRPFPACPQSPPLLPQPPHGEPPRKSTCTMSEGDPGEQASRGWAGTPPQLSRLLPSLPITRPPSRAQPALSNFHFTHRCHWKMDPITQAGLPAASAPRPRPGTPPPRD